MSKVEKKKTRAEILTAAKKAAPEPDYLSTGCTVLDVALTGVPGRAVQKGTFLSLVGDSGSMKTWLSFCLFAEAARNPAFDRYAFVFDNAENGALFDVRRFFGSAVERRLAPPAEGAPGSRTVEDFYYNVEAACRRGPCVYVLDSMDAVRPEAADANFEAKLQVHETGVGKSKVKGSMGTEKARANSDHISRVANVTLRDSGSILLVINQTRMTVNTPVPMKTYGGGTSLKFYSHYQVWARVKKPLTARYRGKEREIGSIVAMDVQKNRNNGWEGKVPLVRFLKGFGVDDLGTCVDYLIDERHWKPVKGAKKSAPDDEDEGPIAAPEFDFEGAPEDLISLVQDAGRGAELRALVAAVWADVVAGALPKRTSPYTDPPPGEPK